MEQMERLKLQLPSDVEDLLLLDLLESAKSTILERRYPYGSFPVDETTGETLLDVRYNNTQIQIAVYLYNKRGVEGQTSHSESGISRGYESGGIPESLMQGVVPLVKVL